jgi:exonuclease SbcC
MAEIDSQLAALTERLARLATAEQAAAVRKALVSAHEAEAKGARLVEERHGAWVREKQDAETKRAGLLQQHEDVEDQLRRLAASGPTVVCPTCGKPLGKEYGAVVEDLEARRDEILLQGKFYRQRIDQLAPEPADLTVARQALVAAEAELERQTTASARVAVEIADRAKRDAERTALVERRTALAAQLAASPTRYDEARHTAIKARLGELEPLRLLGHRLAAAAERAADLVPKAAEAEQGLSRTEAAVAGLRERLAGLGWSPEAYDALRSRFQSAEQERQVAEVRAVRAEAELAAAAEHRQAVAARREDRDRRARAAERLRDDLALNQELDRAFSDLRDELNATIRPDLSDAASGLLRDLTAGRYGDLELNEDYMPVIIDEGEPKTVISGGEEDIANLALRLAISQMIAERAGQPFSLLVLDEVFGSLDDERRTAVVDLLRGLADRFPQVVLITHIEAVRDGFDRIVRIEYDPERGTATAREEVPRLLVPHAAA